MSVCLPVFFFPNTDWCSDMLLPYCIFLTLKVILGPVETNGRLSPGL